jgi:hypothetical protein
MRDRIAPAQVRICVTLLAAGCGVTASLVLHAAAALPA